MNEKIPIIMCIDVEPDGFFIDRTKPLPWKGYEACYEYFSRLRPRAEQVTGTPAHFSWFYRMDPQVAETYGSPDWPIAHYPKYAEDFVRHGDEIGLHSHAYRWAEKINDWVEDLGNQEWVSHCVEMGFECFKKLFARSCDSFRFGAYWINSETINLVEKLGARFDLTVEPEFKIKKRIFSDTCYTAPLPNYDQIPRRPYRPSQSDFTKPDSSRQDGIWIIPMSTGTVLCQYGRLDSLWKKFVSPDDLKPRPVTLNLARGVNGFRWVMDQLLSTLEKPYLAFVVRSDVADGTFFPDHTLNMKQNIDYVLNHPRRREFVFFRPAEAMNILGYLEDPSKPSVRGGGQRFLARHCETAFRMRSKQSAGSGQAPQSTSFEITSALPDALPRNDAFCRRS